MTGLAGALGGGVSQVTLPPVTFEPDRVRDAADDVLARPAFRAHEGGIVQQAQEWVVDRISEVIDRLAAGDGASLLGWAVLTIVTIGAAVLVARFARGVIADPHVARPPRAVERRSAADWRAEAVQLEAAGDRRGALRCRYRALLADLADLAIVEERPGRTAREHRRDIASALPAAAAPAADATRLFEQVWYGGAAADGPTLQQFGELSDRILAEARR